MMSDYSQTIQITSDSQNHVESFIHEIIRQSNDAGRYGVEIEVTRVDVSDTDVEGFNDE
jgi:hypothetical protein